MNPEDHVSQDNLIKLSLLKFKYDVTKEEKIKQEIIDIIKENKMIGYYEWLCNYNNWNSDQQLINELKQHKETQIRQLDEKIQDAEDNLGENEVREAFLAKSEFFAQIGDKDQALSWLRQTEDKTVAKGPKLDLVFTQIRLGFGFWDNELVKRNIERAQTLAEEGGDWERKNRLKVYEGVYSMNVRDFSRAASLFLDSIATFSSYEVMSYREFIRYTILTSILTLERPSLKKKVIDASEVLTVIGKYPQLRTFLNALYDCQYRDFFVALTHILDDLRLDRFLAPHQYYYSREMRVLAYSQFLESYQSVTLSSMASIFGVSVDFLDKELSRFIAAGRLNCKIDKVAGVVETNRPDSKNAQYQSVIKQGDMLLNRVQKLSRVVDI
eukprot:gb/GECH01012081.1/.p1 GENE.gb/GECH01012081.1/~~gb/GECH01012081.1/.p1  ORF type:complete len:383 (+),score=82.99 gb/GECH01012081.1/:1-1149(+)